jgi:hypothetical protein
MKRWMLVVAAAALAACTDSSPVEVNPTPPNPPTETPPQPTPPQPSPTPVGAPTGAPRASATIGPQGGTLVSADGRLVLSVPAGALAAPAAVSVEPIGNHAHGGAGVAYRLAPHGVTFAKPVRLSFRYSDADIDGTVPQLLRVAFQDETGRWRMFRQPQVDAVAGTVTVETTHFSDWSLVPGAKLSPGRATVAPGGNVGLLVLDCLMPPTTEDLLSPLVYECKEGFYNLTTGDWYVNGVVGGSAGIGTVTPNHSAGGAAYRAPARAPRPNPVAVSVEYFGSLSKERGLLVSEITIGSCGGVQDVEEWLGRFDLSYGFSGSQPGGEQLSVSHSAALTARFRRVGMDSTGITYFARLEGNARVNDRFGAQGLFTEWVANGSPILLEGDDVDAHLHVDLVSCTYSFGLQVAVAAQLVVPHSSPIPIRETMAVVNTEWRAVEDGSLEGDQSFPAYSAVWRGSGDRYTPMLGAKQIFPRYVPLESPAGTARVRWSFTR